MTNKSSNEAQAYVQQEEGYRIKALRLYPWLCGRCAREFEYSNLRELTVHHIDHNHSNNPEDGSNWELLCIYCHDNEHNKYHEYVMYGGSTTDQKVVVATHSPFADLKTLLNKSK